MCATPDSGLAAAERDAWLALGQVPGLGSVGMRRLLARFGGPQAIYAMPYALLATVATEAVARDIANGVVEARIDASRRWLEHPDHHLVTLADADYPPLLLQIPDPPVMLFVNGRRDLPARAALAVVGSRNASAQGVRDAEAFARELSDAGLLIVSGLALGIDAAAHRGGLAGRGATLAVIGTGPDMVYPASNRLLARRIAEEASIISEFSPGTPPHAANFPRRNRILSGLSLGCLVVEATLNSGSLITARLAAEQGREVFALPGSIHSPLSRGGHALIRQGARLVEAARDILEELRWGDMATAPAARETTAHAGVDGDDVLWQAMGHAPVAIDVLIERSGLTAQTVSAMLLERELAGQVACLPGGLYQRVT